MCTINRYDFKGSVFMQKHAKNNLIFWSITAPLHLIHYGDYGTYCYNALFLKNTLT